jgi:diaminopimelate decarboxylase
MQNLNFLNLEQINEIASKYKFPLYVYSEKKLLEAVENFKNFPSAF